MTDWTSIWAVLSWIVAGPGAGYLSFWLMGKIPWAPIATQEIKRYASIGITIMLAVAAWLILLCAAKQPIPIGAVGWMEALFSVSGGAYISSQVFHGATNLKAADMQAKVVVTETREQAAMDKAADCDCEGSCECK